MKLTNQSVYIIKPSSMNTAIDTLKDIEHAGRNCYASYANVKDGSYKTFIENLLKRGHETPLEFADMTVSLTTSRAVLAEITRHRMASFCVESQRYIQEAKTGDITFIYPEWYENENGTKETIWKDNMAAAERDYKILIENGALPQEAREVLPNSTACRIVMKANLREWRHIFELRCDKAAYPQMRRLMLNLLRYAYNIYPVVFDDLYNRFYGDANEK